MDYLTQRFDMIAERILENERLTTDLDDAAAQVLLDWGLSCAKLVVGGTEGIEDEEEADKAMYTRLRANSHLMRTVNRWVAERENMDELASLEEFGKVRYYATTVYAEAFVTPTETEWQAFIFSYQTNSNVEMIVNLRNLFDSSGRSLPADEPVQTEQPATEAPTSPQPPADEPTESSQPATEAPANPQPPADELTETSQPVTEAPANPQPPANESTEAEEPATEAPTSPQQPANESTEAEEPATEAPTSPQQPPINEPTEPRQSVTEAPAGPQPPANESTESSQPATEAPTRSQQPPVNESTEAEEPVIDNRSNQNVLLGQVPTNKGSNATDTHVQDRDSKSFVKRVWGWVTSWFS